MTATTLPRPTKTSNPPLTTGAAGRTQAAPVPPESARNPILLLQNVTKRYSSGGGLSDLSLRLPRGGFLFVTGPSGSGKTTLLKLLYGAEHPCEGEVHVNGQAIHQLKGDRLSQFRRQLGVVFQDYKLIPNRTVSENVAFALWAQGCSQSEIDRRLLPTLRLVGLQHKVSCFPNQLSGGEQQRVSIARAIVGTPPVILADEPTGNLDVKNSQQVIRILNQLNRMGATVIVTTHDTALVRQSQHPVIRLQEGKLSWLRPLHQAQESQTI